MDCKENTMLSNDEYQGLTATEIKDAGLTRKGLAELSGINYQLICNRMCGFASWPEADLKHIRNVLAAAKRKAKV